MTNKESIGKKIDWSVIIVNYRSQEWLQKAIESLSMAEQKTKLQWEIIVVDNNSPENEGKELQKDWAGNKRVKIILSKENLGFGKANNLGAQKARGQYLFFLNPDTVCPQELLETLKTLFTRQECGVLAPQLILPNNCVQPYSYGRFPTVWRTMISKLILVKKQQESDKKALKAVDWVSGAAMAIEHDLFKVIGGFDERFFMYFEDVDLCRRVALAGKQNYVAKQLTVMHLGGERKKMTKERRARYFAGQDQYFKIHRPSEYQMLKLIRRGYEWWCQRKDQ